MSCLRNKDENVHRLIYIERERRERARERERERRRERRERREREREQNIINRIEIDTHLLVK